MNNSRSRLIAVCAAGAVALTLGITAFAADSGAKGDVASSAPPARQELTEQQKEQFAQKAKDKLAQALADGRITQEQYDTMIADLENGKMPMDKRGGRAGAKNGAVSAEGKEGAQREEREALRAKWDALTDAQKAELYALVEERAALEGKILDQTARLGLMDQEDADSMKQAQAERLADMRESGMMPMGMGDGMRHRAGGPPAELPVQDGGMAR